MPPEAAVGAAFPPAELAAFTDDRRHRLGPVRGAQRRRERVARLHPQGRLLDRGDPDRRAQLRPAGDADDRPDAIEKACRKGGRFPPGSSNFANAGRRPGGLAGAVVVGVQLAQPVRRSRSPSACRRTPATCSTRARRPGFYGSELLAQAALQWSPAYCLDKQRFKFQLNQMSDEAGWNLMEAGGGAAALRSRRSTSAGRRPGRLRADGRHRLRDRLHHRQARQRRRVHRPPAQRRGWWPSC